MWLLVLFTESTLRRFCEFVQIDYEDSMVNWPPPPPDQAHLFRRFAGALKKASETSSILPPHPGLLVQGEEVQIAIDRAKPIYHFMKQCEADKTFKQQQ